MDWTEKMEHKKKLRKMAGRMLLADVRGLLCSWRCLLVVMMYIGFFVLPYMIKVDNLNVGAMFYFVMWVLAAVNALSENVFNYLPMSTEDIVYYLKCRTNLLIAGLTTISVVTGVAIYACLDEIFLERGLAVLIFLLITVEWLFFMTLYGYSKPFGITFTDPSIPKARKVRIAIYNTYSIVMLFAGMIVWMFMEFDENSQKKLLFTLCAYLVMFIFRADAVRWVRFNEYTRTESRYLYATQQKNQQK